MILLISKFRRKGPRRRYRRRDRDCRSLRRPTAARRGRPCPPARLKFHLQNNNFRKQNFCIAASWTNKVAKVK